MPKTITFNDIYTIEIDIIKDETGHITIVLVYGLLDSDGNKWAAKRVSIDESELTPTQMGFVNKVITAGENKVKQIEQM
jgi:hypothetical protein